MVHFKEPTRFVRERRVTPQKLWSESELSAQPLRGRNLSGGINSEVAAVGSAHSSAPTSCHLEVSGCDSVSLEAEGKKGTSDADGRRGALDCEQMFPGLTC